MPTEPLRKRAVAFVDGQNLFYSVKEAFGYTYPNYDVLKLAKYICQAQGWDLVQARFYTGVPDIQDDQFWHDFWSKKLSGMARQKIKVFSRSLRYQNQTFTLPDGTAHSILVGAEKGVDVRLALDVITMALRGDHDVALILSQDQDLSEVAKEIREIARGEKRWIKIASAFPSSPTSSNRRGINNTDWIRIPKAVYDSCIDTRDYRPKAKT